MNSVKVELDNNVFEKIIKKKKEHESLSNFILNVLNENDKFKEQSELINFVEEIQKQKMIEIWDNKEDEFWENV